MAEMMVEKKIRSALPLYFSAGAFVLGALIFPIYKLWGIAFVAALAAAIYFAANKMIPPRTVMVPAPATVYATGEASLDTVLAKAESDLKTLDTLNARIPNVALSAQIDRMEKAGKAILAQVAKEPAKAKNIRKFAGYYLPTSVKILTTYADLSASGAAGENAQSLMNDVQKNAQTIATAFESQLDALFAGEVLDVSSDITVLDGMVKGDGLTPQDLVQAAASGKNTGIADIKKGLDGTEAKAQAAEDDLAALTGNTDAPITPHLTL
ncbi:MAG: 5-bromo-4-chloroindolyl phosphate hydrolysis family protein [Ruthenibacterium sp.]